MIKRFTLIAAAAAALMLLSGCGGSETKETASGQSFDEIVATRRSVRDYKEGTTITQAQVRQFAGNMLEVSNIHGEQLLVMSDTARQSLTLSQFDTLCRHTRIVAPPIHAIETVGGGSARCMIAEIF